MHEGEVDLGTAHDERFDTRNNITDGGEINVVGVEGSRDHGAVILGMLLLVAGLDGHPSPRLLGGQHEERHAHAHLAGGTGGVEGVHDGLDDLGLHAAAVIRDGHGQE